MLTTLPEDPARFSFQHQYGSSQQSVTLVPEELTPTHTHTCRQSLCTPNKQQFLIKERKCVDNVELRVFHLGFWHLENKKVRSHKVLEKSITMVSEVAISYIPVYLLLFNCYVIRNISPVTLK